MAKYSWIIVTPFALLALVWGLELYRARTRAARGDEKWPRQSPREKVRRGILAILLNAIILGAQLYALLIEHRDYGATAYVMALAASLGIVLAARVVVVGLRAERSS